MVKRSADCYISNLLQYGIVYDSVFYNDFTGLLNHFKNDVSGYVLHSTADTSINAAISICSPLNAIAVCDTDKATVNSTGITQLYDVTDKGQLWAFDTFQTKKRNSILGILLSL